jgi:hypothetical protein
LRALLPFIGAEVGRGGILAGGGWAPSSMVAVSKMGCRTGKQRDADTGLEKGKRSGHGR